MKSKLSMLIMSSAMLLSNNINATEIADKIFYNGKIYTASDNQFAQAIAIKDDRIIFVGSDAEAKSLQQESTIVEDLKTKLVLPGLHDTHIHPMGIVKSEECDLESAALNLEQIYQHISQCLKDRPAEEGSWIMVNQWSFAVGNQPSKRFPTIRAALDAVSTSHPIFLRGNDGHHGAVNSLALANATSNKGKKIGLSKATITNHFADLNELIGVDSRGEPDGYLTEKARELVNPPDLWGEAGKNMEFMTKVANKLSSYGITSVVDAATKPEVVAKYDELFQTGKMNFRLTAALFADLHKWKQPDVPKIVAELKEIKDKYHQHPLIQANAAKIFIDGVIEGNPFGHPPALPNAAMIAHYKQPMFNIDMENETIEIQGYVDTSSEICRKVQSQPTQYSSEIARSEFNQKHGYFPSQCTLSNGILEHKEQLINNYMSALDKAGFTIKAHAIGDRAIRTALDSYQVIRTTNNSQAPHSIDHIQLVHPDDIKRFGELKLFANMTYGWVAPEFFYDMTVIPFIDQIESSGKLYNKDNYVLQNVYPSRTLKDSGATLLAGSDAPVDSREPRPFFNMQQAVTRANEKGQVLNPSLALTVAEVVDAYTINAAKYVSKEDQLGSLEKGKLADFIVIDQDIFWLAENGKANEISSTKVIKTIFNGNEVFNQ